ncbi:MAG: RagB/SusD family nutrient uptake outer membrane protein [Chitinophagaceae bacterium]|nr:MAG: RagB/SusD family nutrient uptake outer membrane protein [Chitinophagaceae bacterium]
MKSLNRNLILLTFVAASSFLLPACNKEYINPSTASVPSVTSSPDALMNLAAGLQRRFTIGRQSPLYAAAVGGGYSVYALYTLNIGNTAEKEVETGKSAITRGNSIVTRMWEQCLLTRTEAETILNNLNVVADPGDRVGLKAYASIFYGLSMGTLVQFFEKIPLENGNNAIFSSRAEALQKAISILESADADLATTNPSAKFLARVPAGIDIKNTVKALLARYYNIQTMITGAYNASSGNKAIAFAQAVSPTVKSEFRFTAATPNPIGEQNATINVYGAIDSTLGLKNGLAPSPAASDPRIGFYISRTGPTTFPLKGFFANLTSAYPVYLPGEMSLIIAENYARQNQFTQSKSALDAVRTKTNDIYGVNAAQAVYAGPLTQADLLQEIYKQRRLELFLSGQELEDSRRFGRPAPNTPNEERNRNFYPYPQIERDNNTSTPDDPAV